MKLIIDITDGAYEAYKKWAKDGVATVEQTIIANGKPYKEPVSLTREITDNWEVVKQPDSELSSWKCKKCGSVNMLKPNERMGYCPACFFDDMFGYRSNETD